jgi:hypothetical protein
LLIAAAILLPGLAGAQQSLSLPSSQNVAPIRPRTAVPKMPPSSQVQTSPVAPAPSPVQIAPQIAAPPPAGTPRLPGAQSEPVLPAVFRGCWRGRVSYLDRIMSFPGAPPVGAWMPKTYVLCYRRVGNGPFSLTFSEAGMEGTSRIANTTARMELMSTDGRSYATMRAYLHFDEAEVPLSFFGPATFAVQENTTLQCNVVSGGMNVSGGVFGLRNGAPWFRAWWHARFVQIAKVPE